MALSESVTIRDASLDDAGALVSFGIKTFRDTFDELNTPENMMLYLNANFSVKKIYEEINEHGSVYFLAEIDNELVGYARVRNSKSDDAQGLKNPLEIERLYVDKKQIGQRIGYLLMKTCMQYAEEHNYQTVWLGVWEHNERALEFYRKWGFEKYGQHVFMLGNDAQTDLLMKKEL
jgi:ribosomal protein S18 acetylase RimI-like enzyme